MSTHTMLSPSNAHRWLHCHPSALLESKLPKETSIYAEEGTLAHEYASTCLIQGLNDTPTLDSIAHGLDDTEQGREMWAYANEYATYIIQDLKAMKTNTLIEQSGLSLEPWVPGGKGTADCVIDNWDELVVVDYKYGKGVKVSAVANPQLMLYALGVINSNPEYRDRIQSIKAVIIQPRVSSNPSTTTFSLDGLLKWADTTVAPAAQKALAGLGDYAPSADVCKFCRGKAHCPGLAKEMFREMDTADRVGLELLTTEDAARALTKAKTFLLWIEAIKQRLEGELKCDRPVPGWKLVEGRSVRKISDPTAAATLLQQAGYPNDLTHKQSLLGITDLEKLCGKKQLPEILGQLIQKAPGSPTMVAEDDPRKKIESVAAMFGDINNAERQPIF